MVGRIIPMRVSKFFDRELEANLVLDTDSTEIDYSKSHYLAVKSMKTLMGRTTDHRYSYYCPACLTGYNNKQARDTHARTTCTVMSEYWTHRARIILESV